MTSPSLSAWGLEGAKLRGTKGLHQGAAEGTAGDHHELFSS